MHGQLLTREKALSKHLSRTNSREPLCRNAFVCAIDVSVFWISSEAAKPGSVLV